jgi:hypothetical protein
MVSADTDGKIYSNNRSGSTQYPDYTVLPGPLPV